MIHMDTCYPDVRPIFRIATVCQPVIFLIEGGDAQESPEVVLAKNAHALIDLATINWLHALDDELSGNQVVQLAMIEFGVSKRKAVALKRLYRIRQTAQYQEFLDDLVEVYRRQG